MSRPQHQVIAPRGRVPRPAGDLPAETLAPEKPDYYDAMPADLKARYDASTPEQQLRFQQDTEELREMLREAEAGGVSKLSHEEVWQSAIKEAEDSWRRDGIIGPDD